MQKISIKREQSQAGLSFAERENRRSLAGGESNFRPQVKNKLLLLLVLLMTAATGAWAQKQITITQGFEDGMGDWTMNHCHINTKIRAENGYEGSNSFRFYYTTDYPQYLISPELDENDGGTMSFYYARKSTTYNESFKVGYSTTTSEPSAFTWGNEQTVSNGDALTYFPGFVDFCQLKFCILIIN